MTSRLDASLLEEAHGLLESAVDLRRRIHAHPEIGLDLPVTQVAVLEALDGLDLGEHRRRARVRWWPSWRAGGRARPRCCGATWTRCQMPEDTGLDFSSDGRRGTCTPAAMTPTWPCSSAPPTCWTSRKNDCAGRVVFMFQPGEEGHGGAKVMLEEGLLERPRAVDRAFAIHVSPFLPSGWGHPGGPMLASSDDFRVTVKGAGGHASMPHDAIDPVPVACEIVTALQTMVTRRVPAFDPAVLTVTRIRRVPRSTSSPRRRLCEGTVRTVSDASRALVLAGLRQVAEHVARGPRLHGRGRVASDGHYPVTVNDDGRRRAHPGVARSLVGDGRSRSRCRTRSWAPRTGPTCCSGFPGRWPSSAWPRPAWTDPAPNHSNRMVLDEPAMATGIALHAAMALG